MTHHPYNDVLRFITAGSVDDGKSTLIGRLLYDSQTLAVDQADALTKGSTASGADIDFSALTDGLEAEREQGITIDVAWRYFRSDRRRFIIADTPGHEQYTRNMVTGASNADAAIVLIDATKVAPDPVSGTVRLLEQTRRHAAVLRLLGVKHIVAAVNKMDLLDFDQARFNAIRQSWETLADTLGLPPVHTVPVSALQGDNIVHRSARMKWYDGPVLLEYLENIPAGRAHLPDDAESLRLPVQYVVREDGSSLNDFRGYMGRVDAGVVRVGQAVRVLPGGQETTISEILKPDGSDNRGIRGDNLVVRLADAVDISRGDMLVDAESTAKVSSNLEANLCWFDDVALNPARKYLLRQTTRSVFARIASIDQVFDIQTLSHATGAQELRRNDIGSVRLKLQKPIVSDSYGESPATGAFILIDETTNRTVAGGMILRAA